MKATFLYADSGISPHYVHKSWAMSVCQSTIKTPMGIGRFDINKIPKSDILLIESLYCLPFAKKYKKKNPDCKIISIIADTSFWEKKLTLARRLYYRIYLDSVDYFIAESEKIKNDAKNYTKKPVAVLRPFLVNKYVPRQNKFNKKILFIGNDTRTKGFLQAIEAVEKMPDFDLFLIGSCSKLIKKSMPNIHVEGRVESLKKYFDLCTYYIHPADFDPCPVAVWEAMYAGLIPIITNGVGQSELFSKNLKKLILDNNDPESIKNTIMRISGLSLNEKKKSIAKCKEIASTYTKEKSIKAFKFLFETIISSLKQPKKIVKSS